MKVLLVGGGAREHALGLALVRDPDVELHVVSKHRNPGLAQIARDYLVADETGVPAVVKAAKGWRITHAVVGPEAPLAAGLGDALAAAGIHVAAPSKAAAEIETNKVYMRRLLQKHGVPGNLAFFYFDEAAAAKRHLERRNLQWAIKPIGLTGGKGVRVFGDHFRTAQEGGAYIDEVIQAGAGGHGVLLEELVDGEEFTIQAFTDGTTVVPTAAVQDHKRLLDGDKGPNTGGMGSYTQADGLLPFLPRTSYDEAVTILRRIVAALAAEGRPYVGPIYGQFMLTQQGPRVIEVNARFGDPEAINVLCLLEGGYAHLVRAMTEGTLADIALGSRAQATVVKYVVPPGYGTSTPKKGVPIRIDEAALKKTGAEVLYANVEAGPTPGVVTTLTSRALAVLGRGETIQDANRVCEAGLAHVKGEGVMVRHDIGTNALIERRVRHMAQLPKGA